MQDKLIRLWPEVSLLRQAPGRIREGLLELGTSVAYQAGQAAIRQGGEARQVLLVVAGLVKVVVGTDFGYEVLVAVQGSGEICGETAMVEGRRQPASVIACTPVRARRITAAQLVEFMSRYPSAWMAFSRTLIDRLHWANTRRADFIACPAPMRVARTLIEVAARHGEYSVPLTHSDISSLAGVALTTTEKALRVMRRQGLVEQGYRRTVVKDMSRLLRFAGFTDEIPS